MIGKIVLLPFPFTDLTFFPFYEKFIELNVPIYSHVAPLTPILGVSKKHALFIR